MTQEPRVSAVFTSVDDRKAWEKITEAVPGSRLFTDEITQKGLNHVYDTVDHMDVWVASDGFHVAVFAIEGLTEQQAYAVRARWKAIADKSPLGSDVIRRLIADTVGN